MTFPANDRWRRFELAAGLALAGAMVVADRRMSGRTAALLAVATAWYFANWVRDDGYRRNSPVPRVFLMACFFLWPVVVPVYGLVTRKGRERWRWALGFVLWMVGVVALGVVLRGLP